MSDKTTTGECGKCKGAVYHDGMNWRHVSNDRHLGQCPQPTTYPGRVMWGIRRHDVGDEPAIWVMEGNEEQAEESARASVRFMTEVANEKGWDNAPELLRCRLVWEVVDPSAAVGAAGKHQKENQP